MRTSILKARKISSKLVLWHKVQFHLRVCRLLIECNAPQRFARVCFFQGGQSPGPFVSNHLINHIVIWNLN